MTVDEALKKLNEESVRIGESFKREIAGLRVGRPTPTLVEDVKVEYYGGTLTLKELATILVQPPNILVIQPWDKNAIQPIEKALNQADIGARPVAEGEILRISLPPLTAERREELVKLLGKKAEEARIAFRLSRDEVRKVFHELEREKRISDDEKFRANERLQKEVDAFNRTIDSLVKNKEKEIMTT